MRAVIGWVVFTVVIAVAIIAGLGKAYDRSMVVHCNNLVEQSKTYPKDLFFASQLDIDECASYGIALNGVATSSVR